MMRPPYQQWRLIGFLLALCEAVAAGPQRPNIVLIVSDDHGREALGCYGNPVIQTPHLDALAAAGTRFTEAYCTTASCSPSRSVILTGQHSHRNGMYGLQHDEHHFQSFAETRTLPVRLSEAGYRTARVGKFHVAPESVYAFQTVLSPGIANDPGAIGRSPVEMVELARDFISDADAAPFFLYFATDDPHRSNTIRANGRPSFETYPQPNPFGNRPEGRPGIKPVVYRAEGVLVPPFLSDTPEARAELAEYYQAVSRLDQGVGRLIELLKESGRYESTLIIYLSDNGSAFPMAKTTLYDSGIRLPCIIRVPGSLSPGVVQDAMINWADITPTLLDFAGVSADAADFDGRSFRAGIEGQKLEGWDEVYASHNFHGITQYYPVRAIRNRQYKLIYNLESQLAFPMAPDLLFSPTWIAAIKDPRQKLGRRSLVDFSHRPRFELYDLQQDPDEVTNLAEDPAHQAELETLIAKLKSWQQASRDPWFDRWDRN